MKKSIFATVFIIAIIVSLASFMPGPVAEKSNFKNLKVLPKDITKEALDSVMDHFSVSLGVKCDHCHFRPDSAARKLDFASDQKPEKKMARQMFKMTSTINKKFFNWNKSNQADTIRMVVCYTCHRGTKHPDSNEFFTIIDSLDRAKKTGRQTPPIIPPKPEQ